MAVSGAVLFRLIQSSRSAVKVQSRTVCSSHTSLSAEDIREKLRAFPGGSIDLKKRQSGIAVITVNNPARMNAFSGTNRFSFICTLIRNKGVKHLLSCRQHDAWTGGAGAWAWDLVRRERGYCTGCCRNILLWIWSECSQSNSKPKGVKLSLNAVMSQGIVQIIRKKVIVLEMFCNFLTLIRD